MKAGPPRGGDSVGRWRKQGALWEFQGLTSGRNRSMRRVMARRRSGMQGAGWVMVKSLGFILRPWNGIYIFK